MLLRNIVRDQDFEIEKPDLLKTIFPVSYFGNLKKEEVFFSENGFGSRFFRNFKFDQFLR
jgi:hypothetical protein